MFFVLILMFFHGQLLVAEFDISIAETISAFAGKEKQANARRIEMISQHGGVTSQLMESCTTYFKLYGYDSKTRFKFSEEMKNSQNEILDLSRQPWRISAPGINGSLCSDSPYQQYLNILPILKTNIFSFLLYLRPLSRVGIRKNIYLGALNGAGILMFNGEKIAVFSNREESMRPIGITILPNQVNTIEVVMSAHGFDSPGVNNDQYPYLTDPTNRILGIADAHLSYRRMLKYTVLVMFILGLIYLVFGIFRRANNPLAIYASIAIFCYGIYSAIDLDTIQSYVGNQWIKWLRNLYIVATLFVAQGVLKYLAQLCPIRPHHQKRIAKTLEIIFIATAALYLISYSSLDPSKLRAYQASFMTGFYVTLAIMGLIFIGIGLWLTNKFINTAEDAYALSLQELIITLFGVGSLFFVYSAGFVQFINTALYTTFLPTTEVQSLALVPILFGFILLLMIGRTMNRYQIASRLIPESVRELIERGELHLTEIDKSNTERSWLLINDISNSSQMKLNEIGTVSHILQTVFHKINKDYLKTSLFFEQTMGDAMILALRAPAQVKDEILEKFIRIYTLHTDGPKLFIESYQTIRSILRCYSKELADVLNQDNFETRIQQSPLLFRTILSEGVYFYGVNHSESTLDAPDLYVMSKAEKLLGDTAGGFYIFENLMKQIAIAIPRLDQFFIASPVNKATAKATLQTVLPDVVFRLDQTKINEFESFLEDLYGGPLFLRSQGTSEGATSKSAIDFTKVRENEMAHWTQSITKTKNIQELLQVLEKQNLPRPQNFKEKNLLLNLIANQAVKLEVWKDTVNVDRMKLIMFKLGVPAQGLLEQIQDREFAHSPKQMLSQLKSLSPNIRNRAARLLKISRVENPFRPDAMPVSEFCKEALVTYTRHPLRYSAESHLFLYQFFMSAPKHRQALQDYLGDKSHDHQMQEFFKTMQGSRIGSLQALAKQYQKMITA